MRGYQLALFALYGISLAVIARLALEGLPYYMTPLEERPRHELYWTHKPGGSRGIVYGIAGSAMMVLMLLYSVRKRLRMLRRLGHLRVWLDLHIYLGVMGPLLVVLHSSFKVKGIIAIAFWSMIAVALSGILGRYLYLRILRSQPGDWAPRVFHYWHILHKPLALAMYILAAIHVVVAWMTGYA